MVIENKFEIGQTVYLVTDQDQKPRIVRCIRVNMYDLTYELASGDTCSDHYDYEMTDEKQYSPV